MIYTLKAILEASKMATCEIDGNWVPCRPLGWPGIRGIWFRVKAAWLVLTGEADAVVWPGGQ